MMMGG